MQPSGLKFKYIIQFVVLITLLILGFLIVQPLFTQICYDVSTPGSIKEEDWWVSYFESILPSYGHRNWITIADSAYPAQIAPGIQVLYTGADHISILQRVLQIIAKAGHVIPIVYLDKELSYLDETLVPGIEEFKARLFAALNDIQPQSVSHIELIKRLNEAAAQYKVLVLKSNAKVPYTTVFMELGCKYWTDEQETKLQRKM